MYDLRTFGDSSSSGASGASRAEMGEVLMRRLKEKIGQVGSVRSS